MMSVSIEATGRYYEMIFTQVQLGDDNSIPHEYTAWYIINIDVP